MTPEEFERERKKSAAELDRATESAWGEGAVRSPDAVLGPPQTVLASTHESPDTGAPPPWSPPAPPDAGPVNSSWTAAFEPSSGLLAPLVEAAGARSRAAFVKFNSDQVQFDNALLTWTAEHFAATHRHYDAVIRGMQKRMDEIDLRHKELEHELVRHVHEMARRIDVVLGEGEKGRVSHEAALRSVRERLREIEEKFGER